MKRPPTLSLSTRRPVLPNISIQLDSPLEYDGDDDDDEQSLQLSSPSSTSSGLDSDPDLSKDLAVLERLRQSVKKNLRLRPIKSSSSLPKVQSASWRDIVPEPSPASSTSSVYYTPVDFRSPSSPIHAPSSPIDPNTLFDRLSATTRPLLIDTRSPASFLASHIRDSINIVIPSLILKRCRKPGGGFQSLDALRQFITTDHGKSLWDDFLRPEGKSWDGDVIIIDEEMNEKDRDSPQSASWSLFHVCIPLLSYGSVEYLKGGMTAARRDHHLRKLIVSGEADSEQSTSAGLFQLNTTAATRSTQLPEIDRPGYSPLPVMSAVMHSGNIIDSTPSPPPSQVTFRKPPPPRRPSILNRIDTKSAERLNIVPPKLQLRTLPVRSATLAVPPSALQPHSPIHLNLAYSNHSPPGSARWTPSPSQSAFLPPPSPSPYASHHSSPRTPGTPMPLPPSPQTARPDDQPPTTEEPFPEFTISTILPNFLYLGPELTCPSHVEALQELGVRRILNIAAECDDDQGLHLRTTFERYIRIPMRDTVEEDNITRGVREACEILDDARLHSAPTYVHCKAGKSRSVTAVMAYLIHANHWTLSRAYSFVLERRRGISPNIGFVSELMTFEEQELGGKSVGVVKPAMDHEGEDGHGHQPGYAAAAAAGRRSGHARESLPPVFTQLPESTPLGPMSANGAARVGDLGQEMEIKDAEGRYRHARRAPVDETTLQPMRRVSKAGLESSAYHNDDR